MPELKFTCPDCGGNTLELVTCSCIVQTPFKLYDQEPYVIYGKDEVLDGDFDMIQCGGCGLVIQDNGNNVDEDQIHDWVEENQIKESICTKK